MSNDPAMLPPRQDPGSRKAALIAWAVLIGAAVAVFSIQQFGVGVNPAQAQVPNPESQPLVGTFDAPALTGKLMVKLGGLLPADQRAGLVAGGGLDAGTLPLPDAIASVPIVAELGGTDAALAALVKIKPRLEKLAADKPEDAAVLRPDVELLEALYTPAAPTYDPAQLSDAQRQRLDARFGWAGKLAQVRGLPDTDPARAPLIDGGWHIIALVTLVVAFIALGLLVGLPLLIVGIVRLAAKRDRSRLERMAPGGSVGIEIAAIFVVCFLTLKLVVGLIAAAMTSGKTGPALDQAESQAQIIALSLQWLILPAVLLWPRIRGLDWAGSRHAVGLHSGAGVFKELGAGVVGYIACLPLLFAGAVVTMVVLLITQAVQAALGHEPASGPVNPLLEYFGASGLLPVLLTALAVIWAPIVEEIVFRGGLLRQLRGPLNIVIAGALTAVVFAAMHGYPISVMAPLVALALGFSLLRYWRGSLIACVVAHALHNALVSGLLILLVSIVG